MNQIYLGNRPTDFQRRAKRILESRSNPSPSPRPPCSRGLPKAPSAYNPIANPKRARARQLYIIERMQENGYITAAEAADAKKEDLKLRPLDETRVHAEYVAEMARQMIFAQHGNEAYTRGLNVYTTLNAGDQETAYTALRKGIMDYERRQHCQRPGTLCRSPQGSRRS